jgi:FlaA1/EpsC-like NDP-sugar epimerase
MKKEEILIIGGTGSLGKAMLSFLLPCAIRRNITILSRDELKQQEFKKLYPDIKCVLGDIRDKRSILPHCIGKHKVFHFAAMKHVDMAELNPEESIKINLLGTMNVAESCIEGKAKYCIFTSTDKAVLPVNVYGMCKGISERYLIRQNFNQKSTHFSVFRWGNVFGSRGSVIHSLISSLLKHKVINITHPEMTRFWIELDDVCEFILNKYYTFHASPLIPEMKAASILRIAERCAHYLGIKDYKVNIIGIRDGEKIHECIETSHNHCIRSDSSEQLTDREIDKMINKFMNGNDLK